MSASAPAADPRSASSQPLIPPEEKFWQRYSPHSEAPLSGVTSTVLHVLALGLLLLVIWVQSMLKLDETNKSLPLEPIRLAGGGGGSPDGSGTGSGGTGTPGSEQGETGGGDEVVKGPPPPEYSDIAPAVKTGVKETFQTD